MTEVQLVNPSFRNNSTLTHIHNTHTHSHTITLIPTHTHTSCIHTHTHSHIHTHMHAYTHTHHTPNTHILSLSTNRKGPVYQLGWKRFLRLLSHAGTPSVNVAISTAHKQRNTGMTVLKVCVCVCVWVGGWVGGCGVVLGMDDCMLCILLPTLTIPNLTCTKFTHFGLHSCHRVPLPAGGPDGTADGHPSPGVH